jgi:hypothetical protein
MIFVAQGVNGIGEGRARVCLTLEAAEMVPVVAAIEGESVVR